MDEAVKARDCALRLLARRDHSKVELKRKLIQRGFPSGICDGIIAMLAEKGYIDDRRFAERWAEAALAAGRCFGLRMKLELQQRGVAADVASEVVAKLTMEHNESLSIRALTDHRFPGFDPLTATDKEKSRIFGFLQRRGFSANTIMALFRGVADE
jgi:regulatory protein